MLFYPNNWLTLFSPTHNASHMHVGDVEIEKMFYY